MTATIAMPTVDARPCPRYGRRFGEAFALGNSGRFSGSSREFDFATFEPLLRGAVARACPRWLDDHREDLVQAAAVRLVERLRDHPAPINATYAWKTAYSVVLDEVRRVRWRHEFADDDATGTERAGDGGAPDPERAAAGTEIGDAILACLETLARPRRHAVALALAGYAPSETAATMGWDVKKAANLTYRGQADLRTCLEGKGVTP